jgi:hypothetical protein
LALQTPIKMQERSTRGETRVFFALLVFAIVVCGPYSIM